MHTLLSIISYELCLIYAVFELLVDKSFSESNHFLNKFFTKNLIFLTKVVLPKYFLGQKLLPKYIFEKKKLPKEYYRLKKKGEEQKKSFTCIGIRKALFQLTICSHMQLKYVLSIPKQILWDPPY